MLVEVDKVALLKAARPHSMDTVHHKEAINDLRLEEVDLKEDSLVKDNRVRGLKVVATCQQPLD